MYQSISSAVNIPPPPQLTSRELFDGQSKLLTCCVKNCKTMVPRARIMRKSPKASREQKKEVKVLAKKFLITQIFDNLLIQMAF